MLLMHRHDVHFVGQHPPGRSLVSRQRSRQVGGCRDGARREVSDSRHAVTPRQSSGAVVPASRTLAWMSSSHADDVLYAVKLEVNEIASVEAQTCALGVGERRAAAPSVRRPRVRSRVHGGRRRPRSTKATAPAVWRICGKAEASAIGRGALSRLAGNRRVGRRCRRRHTPSPVRSRLHVAKRWSRRKRRIQVSGPPGEQDQLPPGTAANLARGRRSSSLSSGGVLLANACSESFGPSGFSLQPGHDR
jgi:hypothetical protein